MKQLLLSMLLLALPAVANADPIEIDGIYYNIIQKAESAEVTRNPNMYSGDIVIPDAVEYEGIKYTVSSIDKHAFMNCKELNSIIIPNSVSIISEGAFAYCVGITSISIPNSVISIGESAFQGCRSLLSVSIPNSISMINSKTFGNCEELTTVNIPNSVKYIASDAFYGCDGLDICISDMVSWCKTDIPSPLTNTFHLYNNGVEVKELVIPNEVTEIKYSFSDCISLRSVTIPNSIKSINPFAFAGCSNLTSISIPNSVSTIGNSAFKDCISLTSITIPSSVTTIDNFAFMGCSSLASIDVPNSVTSIGSGIFQNCISLTSVSLSNSIPYISNYAFFGCISLPSITIPNSVKSITQWAFSGCSRLTSISIPNSVTTIANGAFYGCNSLTSIDIPNSVTSISFSAFEKCIGLTTFTIPDGVTDIWSDTFNGCTSLTSVIIGSGVNSIYNRAFANCPNLSDVYCHAKTIPSAERTAFDGSYIEYATLHVPEAHVSEYMEKEPWNKFRSIVKIVIPVFCLTYMVDGEEYKVYQIEEGATITAEPEPTKVGYSFSGWFEIPTTMPAHDVTVTGSFTINKYNLTYIVDGEEYKIYDIVYGTTITQEEEPTKEGYTFSGWGEIPETMPAYDVFVEGYFTANKYTLTYTIDGVVYKSYNIDCDSNITPEEEPTKEGYTFSGWSYIPETMPAEDLTITGTFSINSYKLTYTVDGEEYESSEMEYGTSIMPLEEPSKEGYTFSGWSDIPETMPAEDVVVTGTFSINSYKLTYMIDNEVYKETIYEYGATIIPEPQPEGNYATFKWEDLPETMPAEDIIIHASYTTGINDVLLNSHRNIRIYTPDGKKRDKFQKGLNVIILDDGTVHKLLLK